jgi:cytochrome c biogenesis protein CcmG/thiol:disulfide interchange protein DsbE
MNKLLTAILVTVLTTGLLITGCAGDSESSVATATVGEAAPNFELQNLDGQLISLSSLKGKPVLVNFWATWCSPCVSEMPYIQEIHEEWSDTGLMVLAINLGDNASEAEQFLQEHNLSLPVLLDTKNVVAPKYDIRYIPTTFFIDKDGIVRNKVIGAFPSKAAIESRLGDIVP